MASAASEKAALAAAVERARTRGPEDVANYAIAVAVSLQ
jgi:hypothetical protein